ncbi:MAG TPA: substrate-binding domain-containing protein [Hyphomicrobiaceae bacterium]|nr:substrate-binding domain-containing protein [Hyphomicrobiaceae bacterium]
MKGKVVGMQFGRFQFAGFVLAVALILAVAPARARDKSIIVQSTTSTKNSGLYEHLLPQFKNASGITVHVVAVGTGQAIKNARNCDGDVLLVHAKSAEQKFVASGYGVRRSDLMYNDFVIVGPPSDPAKVTGGSNAREALRRIASASALFASRGDDSGTHKKEQALWRGAGIDPQKGSGKWYRETGSGMGATLNAGVGMGAYVMTDRATWISFRNKGDFRIAVEGDKSLFNQYGVILVNKARCPNVKAELGQIFVSWLLSPRGQSAIASYKKNNQQLFFPNAN